MKSDESQFDYEQNMPEPSFEPPNRQVGWLWLFFAVLIVISGGAALGLLMSPQHQISSPTNNTIKAKRVKISTVGVGTVEESSDYIASLEPVNSVTLQPKIQGKVTHVFVKLGNPIKAGSAIIQVNSQPEESTAIIDSYYQARQDLDHARGILHNLEAQRSSYLANAQVNQQKYQRYSLLAAQGALSQQAKDEYANNLAAMEMSLGAIDAKIQAQQVRVLQAEEVLKQAYQLTQQPSNVQRYKITAPLTGTITNIPIKVGDTINTSTQIATITQTQPVEIKINVPKKMSSQLRKGMPVEIIDRQGNKLSKTRVYSITNKKHGSEFVVVKALLKNSKSQVSINQLVRARLIFKQRPGVLIPNAAIFRVAEENFVYVVDTMKVTGEKSQLIARQRRIQLGNMKGNNYQVLGGLQPGEKIVVSGLLNLRDGDRIIPR